MSHLSKKQNTLTCSHPAKRVHATKEEERQRKKTEDRREEGIKEIEVSHMSYIILKCQT
jgi:hypothetical protein